VDERVTQGGASGQYRTLGKAKGHPEGWPFACYVCASACALIGCLTQILTDFDELSHYYGRQQSD
jgi:hypothetical protein